MPRKAFASVGFGSKSLKTVNAIPASWSSGVTESSRPACKMPRSVTRRSLRAEARFSSPESSRIAPRPCTMRVGNDMMEGIAGSSRVPQRTSDDLEITLQLPFRHGGFELPAFPLARADVVIHERVAEQLTHLFAPRQRFRRGTERRRQRLRLCFVPVPHRLDRKRQFVLDAVQSRGNRRRDRD